jgi:hypothetical protein
MFAIADTGGMAYADATNASPGQVLFRFSPFGAQRSDPEKREFLAPILWPE